MDRSFASGAAGSAPSYPASPSIGYPTAGNPSTATPATKPGPWWYHMITEELRAVLVAAGLTPDGSNTGQLAQALQTSRLIVANAAGTADAITATFLPLVTALANGMTLYVRAASANATTTPTFTPATGTIAAKTIVKGNGLALAAGDIAGAGHWIELQYDATLDKWVLLNPATGVSSAQPTAFQNQTYTGFTSSGAAPAFTLTPSPAIGAYTANQRFRVKFHAGGTAGSNTLNISGLGAKNVKQYDGGGNKVPAVVAANQLADVEYDGTDMVILDPLNGAPLYESAEQTITAQTASTVSHGLGRSPYLAQLILRCKTTEGGFAVGDEIHVRSGSNSASNAFSFWSNSTTLGFIPDAYITVARRDSPAGNLWNITFANWRIVMRAW